MTPSARILLAVMFAAILVPSAARSQSEAQLEIRTGTLFKIAVHVEDFTYEGKIAPIRFPTGESLEEVLVRDLQYSDFFTISRGPAPSGNPPVPAPPPQGTRAVASAIIRTSWGRTVIAGSLRDAATGKKIFGNDYRVGDPPDRWAVHAFADDIVLYLTGERGVAQTRIAFVRDEGKSREISLVDPDGSNETQLTHFRTIVLSPAWSPAGDRIAFTSFANGQPSVIGLNLATGRPWTIATGGMNASPAWSPDGRRIAFTRSVDGNSEIFIADADGGNMTRVTVNPAIDTSPTFSPDGSQIAFTSDRSGHAQVYVMPRDGGDARRLTFEGQESDSPDWSPKGDRIAFVCMLDQLYDVCTIRPDGSDMRRLTANEGMHENPKWAPDGRHLVYSMQSGGRRRIYIMAADGSGKRALTGGSGDQYNPAWSPSLRSQLGQGVQ